MQAYSHLSYAGNHGDVLKHVVLVNLLEHIKKQSSLKVCYVDTHAGAGIYDLKGSSTKTRQAYKTGILPVWEQSEPVEGMQSYVQLVRARNQDTLLQYYPGSPLFALSVLAADDRCYFFELNSEVFDHLCNTFACYKNVTVIQQDGFSAYASVISKDKCQAVFLIDPPYVESSDYDRVLNLLVQIYSVPSNVTCMIWYPVMKQACMAKSVAEAVSVGRVLQLELPVALPDSGTSMIGSGIFIVNPPEGFAETMRPVMTALQKSLSQPRHNLFTIRYLSELSFGYAGNCK
ncbi:MAG: 23S rRNA (adenine(2030)-N(6))-methyltransferase RlmJ [Gammaproteobacteria bacterium]|nr:23S rRNA (adenine(2030)-N(6))-methyltransferase RlmJ [Gammaproteobacteria bacterium]